MKKNSRCYRTRWLAYITHPWGGFRSSRLRLLDKPRGCQYRERYVFEKLSASCLQNADLFGTDTIPTAVEISTMDNRPRGCDTHHTLDNSLLNMPTGMPIGWDIAYRYLWTPSIGMRICYNRPLFLTVEISTMEIGPGGCDIVVYTVLHGY